MSSKDHVRTYKRFGKVFGFSLLVALVVLLPAQAQVVVNFPDPNLEAAIRDAIGEPSGDIYDTDLVGVGFTSLDASESSVSDLTGIEYCTDLMDLNLYGNQISDISPLSALTNLTVLVLWGGQFTDISALSGLTNLTALFLDNTPISDISALSGLTNLADLSLVNTQISDISALSGLTNLERFWLQGNQVSDINALSGLPNLVVLGLGANPVSDLSVVWGLTNLTGLDLSGRQMSGISAVSGLTSLESLYLHDNQISDISALSGLINLTELSLSSNQISDITALVDNPGIAINDFVMLADNPLSQDAIDTDVAILQGRGVTVYYYELCVVLRPTDAGVGDPLTLAFYVDGVEADLARLDIWGVGMWDLWDAQVIPSLTADMLVADGWSIEWPRVAGLQTRTDFEGIGTFADAIAAGGFLKAGNVVYSGSCEDSDSDGLSDCDELNIHNTDPHDPDTDGDGMSDGHEIAFGYDPLDPNSWTDLPFAAWPVALVLLAAGVLVMRRRTLARRTS